MYAKVIRSSDVRPGDGISMEIFGVETVFVESIEPLPDEMPFFTVIGRRSDGSKRCSWLGFKAVVQLVHRPWPEGKAEDDMLYMLAVAAEDVHHLRGFIPASDSDQGTSAYLKHAVAELREAIEAYELGKPTVDERGGQA